MPKLEAVFDCNIYLQAAANLKSVAAACLRLAENGEIILYASDEILEEVSEVLNRPIVRKNLPELTDESVDAFIEKLHDFVVFIKNVPHEFHLPRDVDDEDYINLAVEVRADYLVSRDRDLLDLMTNYTIEAKEFRQRFRFLKVVNPVMFLEIVRQIENEI
ncbi:MAG: putative toxin-antitoxin system toxin component, PIN family [Acidobacteriota bacterium]